MSVCVLFPLVLVCLVRCFYWRLQIPNWNCINTYYRISDVRWALRVTCLSFKREGCRDQEKSGTLGKVRS